MEDTVSPRVLRKMIYAGSRAASFEEARDLLSELAEVQISAERVRRACHHVGRDLRDQQQQLQAAYQAKPLPERTRGKPAEAPIPEIACVMADGGRYQRLDRNPDQACGAPPATNRKCGTARKGQHWKESRIALLACMSGPTHDVDPQPDLPQALRYASAAEKLAEIGKTGKKLGETDDPEVAPSRAEEDQGTLGEHGRFARESVGSLDTKAETQRAEPWLPLAEATTTHKIAAREMAATEIDTHGVVGPTLHQRSVVASRCNWQAFAPLVASQAWHLGFAAATRKVFVSDGSATIEKLQQTQFSHYTSVLDLLHGLSYALAAARAVSLDEAAAEQQYDAWAALIWAGRVAVVICELATHGERLGLPPPDASDNDPREVVRRARVFFTNHQARMDYPRYRRQSYPLTSSLMESTVKQVSRRVKGSEKFWSSDGAEAMLCLRGAALSDDQPLPHYFRQRSRHAQGHRAHRRHPQAMNN